MHFSSTKFILAIVPIAANAFPAAMLAKTAGDPALQARAAEIEKMFGRRLAGAGASTPLFEPINTFSERQLVNVSKGSGHEYVAPGPNDLRGPCPGLNALANHNFLPHNGYANILQYIEATQKVVGMGPRLAVFLSALGGALDGDILNWSIGGTPSFAQGGATGVLGNGLVGSHNKYETDASPTRPDLYESGNNYKTVPSQFQQLIDVSHGGEVTLDSLTAFRSDRFDTQIRNNPAFFNGPFSGLLVQPAAYTFIYRFMANHSAEFPAGRLDYSTIMSWFGITGQSGNFQATQGGERIPENWYRRAFEYPYELEYFLSDVVNAAALHPKFLSVGGNTGTTNSFTGVDAEDLSGGVFNNASLLQGNNLACYVYQLSAQAKPDILLGALNQLTSAIEGVIGRLGCPKLQATDAKLLNQFPGYTRNPVYG